MWYYLNDDDGGHLPEPEVGELELPAQVVAVLFEDLTCDAQRADAGPGLELGRRHDFVRASVRLHLERQWDACVLLLQLPAGERGVVIDEVLVLNGLFPNALGLDMPMLVIQSQ